MNYVLPTFGGDLCVRSDIVLRITNKFKKVKNKTTKSYY